MSRKKEVENFLARFHSSDNVDEVFMQGYCYWFAVIMAMRFNSRIMYSPRDNHFTVRIHSKLYDITGDVTEKYPDSMSWSDYMLFNPGGYKRIVRDCVMF